MNIFGKNSNFQKYFLYVYHFPYPAVNFSAVETQLQLLWQKGKTQ